MSTALHIDWQNAVQQRIIMEISRPFIVATQIFSLKDQSYLYPFKGFYFFWSNYDQFLPIFLSVIIPYGLLHCYVYTILFGAIFPLNLIINALMYGPLGIHIAIVTTFQQCSSVNNQIFKNYLIKGKLNKVFDTTLCLNGLDRVVIPGKLKRLVPQTIVAQVMDINPISITITVTKIIYSIIIATIPIIGTLVFHYNNSLNIGKQSQQRMMQLTRQRPRQIVYKGKDAEGELFKFGMVCVWLESIPVLGILFMFTDHVGAALLASDLYNKC